MKALFLKYWEAIWSSYWFIPSLMAIGALFGSFATVTVDNEFGGEWLEQFDWLYANRPAGARALLSTIAGSMITVAGVTFSITVVAVSYAASQVGPRLLANFMRDRGNQVTLGVFIATFLFNLMVLRTIRGEESPPPGGTEALGESAVLIDAFVPHLSILVGLLLAMASLGVLIYFIHHIPESIHISNVTAGVARELQRKIDERFPIELGQGVPDGHRPGPTPNRSTLHRPVTCNTSTTAG